MSHVVVSPVDIQYHIFKGNLYFLSGHNFVLKGRNISLIYHYKVLNRDVFHSEKPQAEGVVSE